MHPETVPESNDIETVAPFASSPTSSRVSASTGPASPSSSITPDPVTACASFASTGSDAHSGSCSKPSTASRPAASTWSASRSASTPRPRPANSCSTSSVPSRTSNAGLSPSVPAPASPRLGNAGEHRVDHRSTRRRFPPLRNSSRPDCHPLEPQNSSALAGQRLTESQRRCVEVETEALRSLRVILRAP